MDIKKLLQQKNELKEVWDYLGLETPFPEKEVRRWLLDYDKGEIEAAFATLSKREREVNDAVAYVGKILHNAKLQNMTVEQREAKVSALRSLAGAIGARRKHEAELKAIRQTFAINLPEVCQTFASEGVGVDVGVEGSGVDGVSDAVDEAETEAGRTKPAAATPPVVLPSPKSKNGKTTPKPKTETRSRRCKVCNAILTRNANHICQADPANQTQENPKPNGAAYCGSDFDDDMEEPPLRNWKRIENGFENG